MREASEVGSTASSYEILAKLATGGMAEIFLARSASVGGVERYVVLKRVLPERAQDPDFVRMFLDEARLAAQLQHPHIAQVYDVGKLGDSYFFTMEYVHGETVRGLLERSRALRTTIPIGCALTIAAGCAAGLHHAHARIGVDGTPLAIIHRDVSPSNLMVSYEGSVKVVDFGVAKAARRSSQDTGIGSLKGKIGYMSPEQCRGDAIDRRSDLFSLGTVLWELLVLERLWRRTSDIETMSGIVHEAAAPPSSRRAEIPPELDAIVLRMLAKSPADRYAGADEVLDVVERFAAKSGATIAVSALGRLVREMFGPRPEPWVSLDGRIGNTDTVTVTSEPIPLELVTPHQLPETVPLRLVAPSRDEPAKPTPSANALRPTVPYAMDGRRSLSRSSVRRSRRIAMWVLIPAVAIAVTIAIAIGVRDPRTDRLAAANEDTSLVEAPAVPVASVALDAGVAIDAPSDAEIVAAPAPIAHERPKPPDLAAAYGARRFAEVVATCATRTRLTAVEATACTVSACQRHDEKGARRWLAQVAPGTRRETIESCAAVGVSLERQAKPPPPKPDCKADPFACQD